MRQLELRPDEHGRGVAKRVGIGHGWLATASGKSRAALSALE